MISIDYMYMSDKQDVLEEKGMPTLVCKDDCSGMMVAKVVPSKGIQVYAISSLVKFIKCLGYKKVICKSDNEPAILALKEAARKELDVQVVMEESAVGDHQGNGKAESAIRQVQGQFRAMKDALETRYGRRIEGDHRRIPWLMMHAVPVINRSPKGPDGLTAYRRWKGRKFNRNVAEFGQKVLYLQANSAGKNKLDVRWQEGVWLGIRDESGESVVGTATGVVKAKDFRRKRDHDLRWNVELFDEFKGQVYQPNAKYEQKFREVVTSMYRGAFEYVKKTWRRTATRPAVPDVKPQIAHMGHNEEC